MKKLITILVLLTLCNILIAQDSTQRFQLGVNGFYSYNGIGNNSNINASIVASYGRHSVNAGIILASGLDVLKAGYKPGFQFGYQFYPVRKQKIFNSFIAYDIDVINAKITNKYPTSIYIDNGYYKAMETINVLNIEQYIGYGLKINFLKRFYFTSNIGVGCGWHQKEFIYDCDDGQIRKSGANKPQFYAPTFICKAGLGFNFWPWKMNK